MEAPKKQNKILELLNDENPVKVLEGISKLRMRGKPEHIERIIEILGETEDQKLLSDIESLLYDLKNEETLPFIITALSAKKAHPKRKVLLSALWQSSLDASNHLDLLVSIAINGDYLECLECLTVIENFEIQPTEEVIYNCTMELKNFLIKNKASVTNEENSKEPLIIAMFEVLKAYSLD